MSQGTPKTYAKGVYVREVKESFFSISIKKEDFLSQLNGLEVDAKGYVKFSMGRMKEESERGNTHSVWVDTWKPDPHKSKRNNPPPMRERYSAPSPSADAADDDVPF